MEGGGLDTGENGIGSGLIGETLIQLDQGRVLDEGPAGRAGRGEPAGVAVEEPALNHQLLKRARGRGRAGDALPRTPASWRLRAMVVEWVHCLRMCSENVGKESCRSVPTRRPGRPAVSCSES